MNDFEKKIFNELSVYTGKTQNELRSIFSLDTSAKNINDLLLTKMLGYNSRTEYLDDIARAGITLRTVRVQTNGHVKESMSFPNFKFTELIKEKWEDSAFYKALHDTRFLFIIFDETADNELVFSRVKFWKMSENDVQEAKKVWERTVQIIKDGVILTPTAKGISNNLPKQTESPIAHVRPHAQNSKDTYPLPDGRQMAKQCFWLNRTYIEKIVNEKAEDLYGQDPLTPEEAAYLKLYLVNDLTFLQDINDLVAQKFGRASLSHINPQTLKALGYTCYPDYILKNTFPSAEAYFKSLFSGSDTIDLNKMDPRLIQSLAAVKVLNTLRAENDIVEYMNGRYISFTHIHALYPQITKATLRAFVDEAIQCAGQAAYFNIRSLKNKGFTDPLFQIGLTDLSFDSLIKNSGKVSYFVLGQAMVFHTGPSPATTGDFIRSVINDERQMYIDSLACSMKDEFGVELTTDKLITLSENAGLYYNPSTEKVYCTKQDFYDALHRNQQA